MARESEKGHGSPKLICSIRKLLIYADDVVHVFVALALLFSALFMLLFTAMDFAAINIASILLIINDILFVLIIMELFWTVIRYLKRQEFSLRPFLGIGIISSLRRILMLEAQMSMDKQSDYYRLSELGICTAIVLILVFSYFLMAKVEKKSDE